MTIRVYPSLLPGEPLETHEADGVTVEQWLADTVPEYESREAPPIVVAINGENLPPERWANRVIRDADVVDIWPQPKEPVTIIAAVVAVVAVAASFLLRPKIPSPGNKGERGSKLGAVSAEGNKVRLGDIIPEQSGRYRRSPDYLSAPRRYYVDKTTQAMDVLLSVGRGAFSFSRDDIRIGETPIKSLGGSVNVQVFSPGDNVTGHQAHENWYPAPEVGPASGSGGIRLKNVPDANFIGSVTTAGDTLQMAVPEGWPVGAELDIKLMRGIQVVDGGVDVEELEVIDSVTVSDGGSEMVIKDVNVERDADGNITNVTTTTGQVVSGTITNTTTKTITQETPRRDILKANWDGIPVGRRIKILGSDDIQGVYVVHSITGSEMTLNRPGGEPVTNFPPGNYTAAVDRVNVLYRIDSIATDRSSAAFTRIFAGGATDAGWTAFPGHSGEARIRVAGNSQGGWAGPFLACPKSESVEIIEMDFAAPQGLGVVFGDGNIGARQHDVQIEYRPLGTTNWISVTRGFVGDSRDQLGFTRRIQLASKMTAEVRVRRLGPEPPSTQELSRLEWRELRSRLPTVGAYNDLTVLAMTITGTESMANQSQDQISVEATRRLPVLNPNGSWGAAEPTRGISAWLAYIATEAGYSRSDLDTDELLRLDSKWSARGDQFDFVEMDQSTVKESINRCLRAGMAELTIDAGKLRPVRDEPRSTFEQMYTPQNMTSALERSVEAPRPDDPDGVDVEYINSETWTTETVECRLPGDQGVRAEKIKAEGVTDKTRAWRIGMRRRRELKYRRWSYSFATEMDALNSQYMSYCALGDDVPGYGQSSLLDSARKTGGVRYDLTLCEPIRWGDIAPPAITWPDGSVATDPGTGAVLYRRNATWVPYDDFVVAWRRPDGSLAGPFAAQRVDEHTVTAINTGNEPMPTDGMDEQREPAHVLIGTVDRWSHPVLITDISPQGMERVNVKAVGYDDRIYADDNNAPE